MTTPVNDSSTRYNLAASTYSSLETYSESYESESDYVETNACLVFPLSDRDEEIMIVQSLKNQIEPNNNESQTVNRAIERCAEYVNRYIKIIENQFKSINDNIEQQILNASQALNESLNNINNSLVNIFIDRKSDEFLQFDSLKECIVDANELISKRNQNINDYMIKLRDLEKERTELIESCDKQNIISNIKQLSIDSFQQLYNKYLKNYNIIKLRNFRTYEDFRFKLIQQNESLYQDFLHKTIHVKLKIKENIGNGFINKFNLNAKEIILDKISSAQIMSINILNDLNRLFNKIIKTKKNNININIEFLLEFSNSIKLHSEELNKISESLIPLYDEVSEEIQSLLDETLEEFNTSIIEANESLDPGESTAINNQILTEANRVHQEKIKTILDIQLLLSDVKDAVNVIDMVLDPAMEIIYGHSGRLMNARNIVLIALDTKFKTNDLELNILENNFNIALDTLAQSSNELDVTTYEQKCDDILNDIKNKIKDNHEIELDIISHYKSLMITELDIIKTEIQMSFNLFPNNIKSLPEFNSGTQHESWRKSIDTLITSFKIIADDCQNTLSNNLSTHILELKSSDLLNNEFVWSSLLIYSVNERLNVAEKLLEFRSIRVHDGIAKKRINEIEQHKNLLERHIQVAQEKNECIKLNTDNKYKLVNLEQQMLIKNVEQVMSKINELSTSELTESLNDLREQINILAQKLNNNFKLHYEYVELEYNEIANSTLEFMKSIKLFPEGGNYSDEEAVNTVNSLSVLSYNMFQTQTEISDKYNQSNFKSIIKIKESLSTILKPVEIEFDKKIYKQKCHSINKLMHSTVNQEILKLEKTMDSLHTTLHNVEKTFEMNNVEESSKCWSEMLSIIKPFIGYMIESYIDIRALLNTQINISIWNTKFEKAYISSKITSNSQKIASNEKFKFYDYRKIITRPNATTGIPRFLNNVYSSVFYYISEIQNIAADMASIESTKFLNIYKSNMPQSFQSLYYEIMDESVSICRSTVSRAEAIWIIKLSDFFYFLYKFRAAESKFKNIILTTYHEESLKILNQVFETFRYKSEFARKFWKPVREKLHEKLKPSYGHYRNVYALESLVDDFQRVFANCSKTLSDLCSITETKLGKIAEDYEKMYPKEILEATTLTIKCLSNLKAHMDQLAISSTDIYNADSFTGHEHYNQNLKNLFSRITLSNVKLAVNNIIKNLRSETSNSKISLNNTQLWLNNVQTFSKLHRDRVDDVYTFSAVENTKLIDWATNFVRDIELVKKLHIQNDVWTT